MKIQAWENAAQPMWKTGSMLKRDVCLLMSSLTPAEISRTCIFFSTVLLLRLRVLPGPCRSHPAKRWGVSMPIYSN